MSVSTLKPTSQEKFEGMQIFARLCWPSSYNPFIRVPVNQIPEAFLGAKSLIYVIVCISLEPFSIIHFYMNCVLIYELF